MYTDFHDQNHNSISPSVVMPAVKNHIIRHSGGFELLRPDGQTPFAYFGEDDYIRESFVLTNSCGSDGIKLGSVNIGMMKVTVKNENVARIQSPDMLIDCVAHVSFDLTVDDNTTADVRYGAYFVKEVEQLTEGVKLTCYDGMCKLDAPFSGALSGTPYQILTTAATACGVRAQSTQAEIEALPNGTKTFTLHEDNDCKTWRDVLSYLTALMGCFVTFGRLTYGAMTLPGIEVRPFGNGKDSYCDTVTDVHRYKGAKFSIFDTEYKAIELTAYAVDGEDTVKKDFTYAETTGVTGQTIKLGYNPFIQADTPEADLTQTQRDILHELLTQVALYNYTPMQISLPVGFIYDLGDVIKCTGGLANTGFAGGYTEDCYCCISNYTYTYGKEFRIKTLDSHAGKGRPIISPKHIYGVEWDCTDTTLMARTDDSANFSNPESYVAGSTSYGSPFDNLMPWSGIVRETNTDAGEVVKIPKFWYKTTFSSSIHKFRISDAPEEGFSVAPAFMDRGDGNGERDYIYVGRYHCSSSDYKSSSDVLPMNNKTRAEFRSAIHNLGSNIWQWDYATYLTIQMLYLVEYANWDVNATIGLGRYETSTRGSQDIFKCGKTDSMPYHTGTISASHSDSGCCQYRYIEGLWDNVFNFVDGIYFNRTDTYAIKNPSEFSDTSNGFRVRTRPRMGSIKNFNKCYLDGYDWFFYPWELESRDKRDYTHGYHYAIYEGCKALSVGASWFEEPSTSGLFNYRVVNDAVGTYGGGSRLMVLP